MIPVQFVLNMGSGQFGGGARTMATVKFVLLVGEVDAHAVARLAVAMIIFASDGILGKRMA